MRETVLILCGAVLLWGCRGGGRDPAAQRAARLVIPASQESGHSLSAVVSAAAPTAPPSPKIALGSGEKLITAVDENLNLEHADEQILVTKDVGETDTPIRVSVVEYDSVLQTYRRSWEALTSATDERYFSVSTADVVGDHVPQIICRGATLDDRYTMDIYRRSAAGGTKLAYSPIFSAVAAGDISIHQEPRSQAYLAGDADGKPFAITVTERDPKSQESVDLLKTTYQWSTRDRRYLATGTTRVRGETVEREQLQALFSSDSPKQYLEFLGGSWARSQQGSQTDGSVIGELIRLSPQDRTLQIYSAQDRVQEEYVWDKADCYYGNVTIRNARNSILPDITKDIRVSVQSLNEVLITVESTIDRTDFWKATYRRVSEQAMAQELATPQRPESVIQPTGLYESKDGEQILFQAPRFTWIRDTEALSGGFYLYRLDTLVLGLLVRKGYGDRPEERAYIAEQSTRAEPSRMVLTLTLRPAELTVYGARAVSDEVMTFTQIQAQPTRDQPAR